MMWIVFAAKYWREIIIVILAFLLAITMAFLNYKIGELKKADQKCLSQIQQIEKKNLKALTEKQNQFNQVSADYEKLRSEQNTKVETVTREVQKIVERPIYLNRCIDDDGVHQINSLIEAKHSS